ncbi:hypothetical protein [Streptomyces sp. NPDC005244]|uniref:hypothetical protein n=1 Tax=Streptomyces sp. NPDC005244 TaxID=3364708 RepID=UPI0036C601A3
MTSDAWQQAKNGISRLFGRSEGPTAEDVSRELEENRQELTRSMAREDPDTADELRGAWRGKFRRLLVESPEAAEVLRELIKEWDSAEAGDLKESTVINQSASAKDHGRVYQQGSGTQINY